MSNEVRAAALTAAISVDGNNGSDLVLKTAAKFAEFILGNSPQAVKGAPSAAAAKPASAAKPAAAKPAAAKPVAAKPATPDPKRVVGDKVNELLKANKRDEAVALLASFDGAQSATGIVSQGDEVIAAFLAGADEILSAGEAADGLAD